MSLTNYQLIIKYIRYHERKFGEITGGGAGHYNMLITPIGTTVL